MFIATLLVMASQQKLPENVSIIEWINTFLGIHTAIRMNSL